MRGLIGLALLLALAYAISSDRKRIPWRTVLAGLAIQIAFAVLVLRWSVGKEVLDFVAGQVKALVDYAGAGIDFLFGPLVADKEQTIFALQVLPVIIFLGALDRAALLPAGHPVGGRDRRWGDRLAAGHDQGHVPCMRRRWCSLASPRRR